MNNVDLLSQINSYVSTVDSQVQKGANTSATASFDKLLSSYISSNSNNVAVANIGKNSPSESQLAELNAMLQKLSSINGENNSPATELDAADISEIDDLLASITDINLLNQIMLALQQKTESQSEGSDLVAQDDIENTTNKLGLTPSDLKLYLQSLLANTEQDITGLANGGESLLTEETAEGSLIAKLAVEGEINNELLKSNHQPLQANVDVGSLPHEDVIAWSKQGVFVPTVDDGEGAQLASGQQTVSTTSAEAGKDFAAKSTDSTIQQSTEKELLLKAVSEEIKNSADAGQLAEKKQADADIMSKATYKENKSSENIAEMIKGHSAKLNETPTNISKGEQAAALDKKLNPIEKADFSTAVESKSQQKQTVVAASSETSYQQQKNEDKNSIFSGDQFKKAATVIAGTEQFDGGEISSNNIQKDVTQSNANIMNKELQQEPQSRQAERILQIESAKDIVNMAKLVNQAASDGVTKLTVKINPENLGKIEIQLMQVGEKLEAKFFTDNNATKNLLTNHGDAIRQQLADKGIHIENMNFGMNDTASRQGFQNGESRKGGLSQKGSSGAKETDNGLDDLSLDNISEEKKTGLYA